MLLASNLGQKAKHTIYCIDMSSPASDSDPPVPATAEQVSEETASNDDATSAEDPSTPAADEAETIDDEDNEAAMEMLPPIAACLPDSPKPVDVPSPVATPKSDENDNVFEESEDLFASQSEGDATPPRHKDPPTPEATPVEATPVEATAVEAADTVMTTTTTEVQVPALPVVVRRVIPILPAPAQGILKAPSQKIVIEEVVDTTADTVAKWLSKAPKTKDSKAKQKNIVAAAKASRTAAVAAPTTTTTTLPRPTAPPTDQTALLAAARLAKVDSLATIALGRNFSKAAAKLTTKPPKPKLVARKTLGTFSPQPPKARQHVTPSNGGAARPAKKQKKATTPTTPSSTGKKTPNSLVFEGFPSKPNKDGWPQGWIERRYRRNSGAGAGRTEDSYFFPPGDLTFKYKLRSIPEVKRFLEVFNQTKDLDKAWKARKG